MFSYKNKTKQNPPLIRNYFLLLQTFLPKWQLSEILPQSASGPAPKNLYEIRVLCPQGQQYCILRKKIRKMVLVHLKHPFFFTNTIQSEIKVVILVTQPIPVQTELILRHSILYSSCHLPMVLLFKISVTCGQVCPKILNGTFQK